MKRLLLIFIVVFLSVSMYAQSEPKFVYSEIVGTSRFMSAKVTIVISSGQLLKYFSDNRLKDSSGKPIVFNSMVDALNFMGKQGWEFVQAYTITESNVNVYHFLLKRPFKEFNPDEQKEILQTN